MCVCVCVCRYLSVSECEGVIIVCIRVGGWGCVCVSYIETSLYMKMLIFAYKKIVIHSLALLVSRFLFNITACLSGAAKLARRQRGEKKCGPRECDRK